MISYNFKDCNVLCYCKYYTVKQTSMNIVVIRTRVRHEPQKRNGKHYNWKKLFHGSCKIGPRIIRKQLKNRCWTPVLRLLSPPPPPAPLPRAVTSQQESLLIANDITSLILLHEKFLQFDRLRGVVFQPNLKYVHVKITNPVRVVV